LKLAIALLALAAAAAPATGPAPVPITSTALEAPPPQEASLAAHGAYLAKLRAKAEKTFASGDTVSACVLAEKVAELAPDDASAQLDLGFCRFKQDERKEALEATFKAIALGNDKVRRDAYYNLGVFKEAPELTDVMGGPTASSSCGQYVPSDRCSVPLRWCTVSWQNGGKSLEESTDEIVLSTSRTEAIECAEQVDRASGMAVAGRGSQRPDLPCATVTESSTVIRRSPDGTSAVIPSETCKIVYTNACSGRIGLSCKRWDSVRLRYYFAGEERSVAPARE
jgi:tetratricopeptide (TPR) repeat protein